MSPHIDVLLARVAAALRLDTLAGTTRNLEAILWDIDCEAWERGVMWNGGTFPPERPVNPYRCGSDD